MSALRLLSPHIFKVDARGPTTRLPYIAPSLLSSDFVDFENISTLWKRGTLPYMRSRDKVSPKYAISATNSRILKCFTMCPVPERVLRKRSARFLGQPLQRRRPLQRRGWARARRPRMPMCSDFRRRKPPNSDSGLRTSCDRPCRSRDTAPRLSAKSVKSHKEPPVTFTTATAIYALSSRLFNSPFFTWKSRVTFTFNRYQIRNPLVFIFLKTYCFWKIIKQKWLIVTY